MNYYFYSGLFTLNECEHNFGPRSLSKICVYGRGKGSRGDYALSMRQHEGCFRSIHHLNRVFHHTICNTKFKTNQKKRKNYLFSLTRVWEHFHFQIVVFASFARILADTQRVTQYEIISKIEN